MSELKELKEKLQQKRDELKVQADLAAMDARDEWEKLERVWDDFEAKAKLEESKQGISEALHLLGEELHNGYERLKKALKS